MLDSLALEELDASSVAAPELVEDSVLERGLEVVADFVVADDDLLGEAACSVAAVFLTAAPFLAVADF